MKILKFTAAIFLVLNTTSALGKTLAPAKPTIEKFYHQYLDLISKASTPRHLTLPNSKSFQKLIDRNDEVCKQKAGTDVCGFGSDGDIYLNAQEIDPKLRFQNSGFSAAEPKPGEVEVNFNVYPSAKTSESHYHRKILFLMIKEGGMWVVDDILYDGKSARKQIGDEIDAYQKPTSQK